MKYIKKLGKSVFFPHGAIFILLVPLATILLIYSFTMSQKQDIISYVSYSLSAYTLTAFCCKAPSIIRFWIRIKQENKYAVRYFSDARLRVLVSLYGTFIYNSAYAIFQMVLGIHHSSVWFGSMALYYALLATMRLHLLLYTKKHSPNKDMVTELRKYRFCGIMLLIMNTALGVIIFYITWQNRTFRHHEITTIAMAAYTFLSFTMAIVNVFKYKKYDSPVFSASKIISFTCAMVSMLTLETAMLTVFGETESQNFHRLMTGATGAVVDITVLIMAIYMIVNGTREIKKSKTNTSENMKQ